MHEWALAESILMATIEAAEKDDIKKITEIQVSLGELQQIDRDNFTFALNEIIKSLNDKLQGVKIIIKNEKASFRCKNCENIWNFNKIKTKLNQTESEAIHFVPEITFVHTSSRAFNDISF